jgi:ABC-type sugar transport system ATPase subunit
LAWIVLERVTKRFGKTNAVDAVDLEVEDGELVVPLGPSGCGKTTLLRSSGPPAWSSSRNCSTATRRSSPAASASGVGGAGDRDGAGRLLMDEPLSNLDALLRLTFRAELKKLVSELGTTAIYVTNDQVEALSLGDRIAVMNHGRIVQHDTPTRVYAEPAASGETLVGIRAENIVPATEPSPGALPARTQVVEPLGSHLLPTAQIGELLLKVVAPVDFPAHPNRGLWLRLEPAKLRLSEPDGDRLPP